MTFAAAPLKGVATSAIGNYSLTLAACSGKIKLNTEGYGVGFAGFADLKAVLPRISEFPQLDGLKGDGASPLRLKARRKREHLYGCPEI